MNIFRVINKSLKRYKVPGRQSILAGGVRSSDEMIVETLEAVLGPGAQETEAVVVAAADVVHGLGPGARRGLAVVRVGGRRRPRARPAAAARPSAPGPAAPQHLAAAGQRQQRGVTREARAGAHRAQVLGTAVRTHCRYTASVTGLPPRCRRRMLGISCRPRSRP